jgi:16S rRNA processing protein RimM
VETLSGYEEKRVLKAFVSGQYLALQLEGLHSRESVEVLYHKKIYVHESQISLKEEEFLVAKLIGYEVISTNPQRRLGAVIGVSSFGAQDNLEIMLQNKLDTVFYPFVDRFVKNINKNNKTIEVLYLPEFFGDTHK